MDKFDQVVEYLYTCTPQFQQIGAAAYKPGLQTAVALDKAFGSPHRHFKTIHVAGTNGKGSTSHTLAAILSDAGYKVGLYTSPHLVDFRERIRVNGEMITKDGVVDFVERYKSMNLDCEPSFFELTTIMAFDWFARQGVDVAVIETGLGGRLDTTNIIGPVLSIITNISLDHVAQLGNSLLSIAREKAGIIKRSIPVVIGEAAGDVRALFEDTARVSGSQIYFAEDCEWWTRCDIGDDYNHYYATPWGDIEGALTGECQERNAATIFCALNSLSEIFRFSAINVANGFKNVIEKTGLMGRWMRIGSNPTIICDTGHNTGGWEYTRTRLQDMRRPLAMVIGFVNDKDVDHILEMMPADAHYYFTQASIPRALSAEVLKEKASRYHLNGEIVVPVKEAVARASCDVTATGSVFVGGSTFVVADLLKSLR